MPLTPTSETVLTDCFLLNILSSGFETVTLSLRKTLKTSRLEPLTAGCKHEMLTPVLSMAQVAEGDVIPVRVGQQDVLVGMVEGQYFAVSAFCSHARQNLATGRLRGFELSCPLHGARFDVRTGACTRGPAEVAIERFPVVLEGGKVCVDI